MTVGEAGGFLAGHTVRQFSLRQYVTAQQEKLVFRDSKLRSVMSSGPCNPAVGSEVDEVTG